MRLGERTKRVLALLTAGAMVFTNTGMDVLASTSIVVGGITSGEDKKDETPTESESLRTGEQLCLLQLSLQL